MTKQELATLLDGRTYGNEITREEEKLAKENRLLVCFGASDDLLEFRGIINDEDGAGEDSTSYIVKDKNGKLKLMSENTLEELNDVLEENDFELNIPKVEIRAEWCPDDLECSWKISSEIPHSTFDIMEDGDLYCRGIVIEEKDLLNFIK